MKDNMQIINDVKIDWSKFKSKATGKHLENAKQSYIDFCVMLHSNGHTLLSDYTNVHNHVLIRFNNCGHETKISPMNYKYVKGNIKCSKCTLDKYDQITLPTEEPKYNKEVYTIGFYNDKVDDIVKLCNCNRVFNDITSLKYHIRDNDIVVLASQFSLYGIDKQEIQRIKDAYNVEFRIGGSVVGDKLNTMLKLNEYVQNNKDMISKLVSNI